MALTEGRIANSVPVGDGDADAVSEKSNDVKRLKW